MKRILVIFSHPALQSSRANRQLLQALDGLEGITLHDLYHHYPDMFIDVKREQALLSEHDIIVFQHPFYWYSCPAIMKEWMDLVLEYGYAYGPEAHALNGKQWLSAITTGGAPESYCSEGYNQRPLLDLDMRLGEASGAALAVPILKAAAACHNGMATFTEAGVSSKDA